MLRSSFILPFDKLRAGYLPLMVSLSNHALLAGACPGESRGELFTEPPNLARFSTFYEFINRLSMKMIKMRQKNT